MREPDLGTSSKGVDGSVSASTVDGWRGVWSRVTRRGFMGSILAALGSRFRKNTVMAAKGGPDPMNAALRKWIGTGYAAESRGIVTANAPDFAEVRSALGLESDQARPVARCHRTSPG